MSRRKRPGKGLTSPKKQPRGPILWLLLGAAVLALLLAPRLLGGGEGVRESQEPPQRIGSLEVSATQVDLGRVPLGRWVKYAFHLRNVGPAPLTITIPREGIETLEGC